MIIDFIATLLEEIILSTSIANIIKTNNSLLYVSISSLLCILETYLISFLHINDLALIILIIITHLILLLLISKDNVIKKVFVISFFVLVLLCSDYISLYLVSMLNDIPVIELSKNTYIFNFSVLFSKFIFAITSFCICLYIKKRNYNISLEKHEIIIAIIIDIVFIFTMLGESLVYGRMLDSIILIIMFQLIILSILFCFLYNRIQIQNLEKIKLIKRSAKFEYLKINNDRISHMYNTILTKEHSMIYFLRKIVIMIENGNNNNEIISAINNEIDNIISYKFIANTGNPNFDIEFSNKINILKEEGYDIKNILMISNDYRINDDKIINQVCQFIEFASLYSLNKKIELRIKNDNNALFLKATSKYDNTVVGKYKIRRVNARLIESIEEIIILENYDRDNK